MLLSVSRRTDIPRWYFSWFLNRLAAGEVLVRNPMNPRQVSRVALGPEVVDCIIFWTKDPAPMLGRLEELEPYPWYLQFTLHAYGPEVEPGLPPVEARLGTFKKLAAAVGPKRVVWRYSPVLLNARYTAEWHLATFERLAQALEGRTLQCKLSFLEHYAKIEKPMAALGAARTGPAKKVELARAFAALAARRGIALSACGEVDLAGAGIPAARCVDDRLVSEMIGETITLPRDTGQRQSCYCAASVDIGAYGCCPTGCAYCYANRSPLAAQAAFAAHPDTAPMLCGAPGPHDVVTDRPVKSHRLGQLRFY